MATKQFGVNTENHVAEIPGIGDFEFRPEADSDELLDARVRLMKAQRELKATAPSNTDGELTDAEMEANRDAVKVLNAEVKGYIAGMMTDESAERFLAAKLPDRTITEMQDWILGVYGLRPTTSSSDSSEPSATTSEPGDASTEPSPSEA